MWGGGVPREARRPAPRMRASVRRRRRTGEARWHCLLASALVRRSTRWQSKAGEDDLPAAAAAGGVAAGSPGRSGPKPRGARADGKSQWLQLWRAPQCSKCKEAVLPQALMLDEDFDSNDYYEWDKA